MPQRIPRDAKSKPHSPRGERRDAVAKSRKANRAGSGGEGQKRLQQVLAAAGAGSRRQCEELIVAGRVEVDGQVVTELGTKVDPERQEIRLDGTPIRRPKFVYYAVNKPKGVVSTSRDPSGAPRVIDLVPPGRERVYTVGRLDKSSEGLILVTNDGELADRLTHPRYEVEKQYQVLVQGVPTPEVLRGLREGVRLAEGVARVAHVKIKSTRKQSTMLEMVLREGRNREIRRLMARMGHKVLQLKRIAIGPVRLKDQPSGSYRRLSRDEVDALRRAAHQAHHAAGDFKARRPTRRKGVDRVRLAGGGPAPPKRAPTAGKGGPQRPPGSTKPGPKGGKRKRPAGAAGPKPRGGKGRRR